MINTVYIAGTIDRNNFEDSKKIFDYTEKRLRALGLNVLSPMRGKLPNFDGTYSIDQYSPNEIVHRDEHDIDRSDILLANLPSTGIGTPMEIYRAREICKIPVVVVSTNPVVTEHYWIRNKASQICSSIDEAIDYIQYWFL